MISSDHVLQHISPNIGLYARQSGDPLGEYLRSLQLVRDLPVKLVLPGHGWQLLQPFDRLAALSETLAHLHYLTNQAQASRHVQDSGIFYRGDGQTSAWKHA